MNLIIVLIIGLLAANLFVLIGKKIKFQPVVSLILCGLFLDIPHIKAAFMGYDSKIIFTLGDIALLCLMFLAGLESSWTVMYKERKDAVFIAVFAALTPFLLGFVVFKLIGFSLIVSLIVGICMSITSEATKARVLLDLKKLRTRVGSAMMGAGIIDDIIGLSLFILVTYLLKKVYVKEDLFILGAILIFFVGIWVQKSIGRKNIVIKNLEKLLLILVVPFFFISVGLHVDFGSFILNPLILIFIIAAAFVGKLSGALLTHSFTKLRWSQLYLIGWAMNSRGAVEMALALIAFRSNLIPHEIYSSLIIMALVTTLVFPFMMTKMIKKDHKIMN